MTALKPITNRLVRSVPSERYPLNAISAHPTSTEPATDPHHIFPRSQIKGDSWFVEITEPGVEPGVDEDIKIVIPHVTGLTREEHRQVEEHEAWIKLEGGVFNWYDRVTSQFDGTGASIVGTEWELVGPLNPQPGAGQGKPKRKKFQGEARRKRITVSVKVPQDDQEDGAGIWDDTIDAAREKLLRVEFTDKEDYPPYNVIVAGLQDWITD